jgi:hypothetical protein
MLVMFMKILLLIDGSNLIHYYNAKNGKKYASGNSLLRLEQYFSQLKSTNINLEVLFMVDSTLRFRIDYPKDVYQLIKSGRIIESPPQKKADEILLNMHAIYGVRSLIISNDHFKEYPITASFKETPWRLTLHQKRGKITIPGINKWIQNVSGQIANFRAV